MNVLFQSPLGALLAKPWVDQAGLFGLRRWYRPLSRLWAAANQAGTDAALFREQVGALPAFWSDIRLRRLLGRHDRLRQAGEAARAGWEAAIFDPQRRRRSRRARPPPACGRDAPPLDACCILSAAVSASARRLALADRSAGQRSGAGCGSALRGIARCGIDRGVASVRAGWLARMLAARADAVGTAAHAARQRDDVCPRRRAGRAGRRRNADPGQRPLPRVRAAGAGARSRQAARRDGLAGDRADLALSRAARHAGFLWRRAVLRPGADRLARPDRRAGSRDGAAHGVGARPLSAAGSRSAASRCRRSSRNRSPAIAAFGRSRRGPMPCC